MFILLLFYGGLELITLFSHGDSIVTNNGEDSYFKDTDVFMFDKQPGFHVAFGLTGWDEIYEFIDEPEYATIGATVRTWSADADKTLYKDVNIRHCTQDELGIGQ